VGRGLGSASTPMLESLSGISGISGDMHISLIDRRALSYRPYQHLSGNAQAIVQPPDHADGKVAFAFADFGDARQRTEQALQVSAGET
jgi:hypothetical protein